MKRLNAKLLCILLAVMLTLPAAVTLAGYSGTSAQEGSSGFVTVSVEQFTMGWGFVAEPELVPIAEGDTAAMVLDRFLRDTGLNYKNTGTIGSGFYLQAIESAYIKEGREPNVPAYILEQINAYGGLDEEDGDGFLGEFDYTAFSGWMIAENNALTPVGASEVIAADGDVFRWQYTLYGYGMDLGMDNGWGGGMFPPFDVPANGVNRDALTKIAAVVNSADNREELIANPVIGAAYHGAIETLGDLCSDQSDVDQAFAALDSALNGSQTGPADISLELNNTLSYLYSAVPEPVVGSVGGEWAVLALARGGYFEADNAYYAQYYNRVAETLEASGGVLHSVKFTEYSRVIMALSSIGRDSTNVGGYNLVERLADYDKVIWQGVNGPVYALIALDTIGYDIPPTSGVATRATREMYLQRILDLEIDGGGWSVTGGAADVDMTAMTMQALSRYMDNAEVAAAVERGLNKLSGLQRDNGGYASWGSVNAESCAQVVIALSSLNIDPANDARFVKDRSVLDALLDFYVEGGGFKHVLDGEVNQMATEQAAGALVAYSRFANGLKALYDMTDVVIGDPDGSQTPKITLSLPENVGAGAGSSFTATLGVDGWPEGEFKLLDGVVNIPEQLDVTNVTMSAGISGGEVEYHLDTSENKLRFVYFNTQNSSIEYLANSYPAELVKIELAVREDLDETPLRISVGGVSLKANSDSYSEDAMYVFDNAGAFGDVTPVHDAHISAYALFTGDGVDLIPANRMGVAITVANIDGAPSVRHRGGISLYYSQEMSEYCGLPTYTALVDASTELSSLANAADYTFGDGERADIRFGDVNGDGLVNAQDALDSVSIWLRRLDAPQGKSVLAMNVNADTRLNTFDALGVMEHYVNGADFPIIGKAFVTHGGR